MKAQYIKSSIRLSVRYYWRYYHGNFFFFSRNLIKTYTANDNYNKRNRKQQLIGNYQFRVTRWPKLRIYLNIFFSNIEKGGTFLFLVQLKVWKW